MSKNPWTPHPWIPEPTQAQVLAFAQRSRCSEGEAAKAIWTKREEVIRKEAADPMVYGWEPPKWKVCDALLGRPWVDQEWAKKMRAACGFSKPVQVLLILGGQRSSKSEYAGKGTVKTLQHKKGARAWCLHTNGRMSVEYQQPLIWKFLPPQLRAKDIATKTTYIKYRYKTGFSDDRFVMPNMSDCSFLSYEMERTTVEGGNVDWINPDELVPSDWVETMRLRIAEKRGCMVITFTPVQGYNDTVRMFMDGATVTRESTAFLLPKDGGEPDVRRALGLTEEEFGRLRRWVDDPANRPGMSVWSRPEACGEWICPQGKSTTVGCRLKAVGDAGAGHGPEERFTNSDELSPDAWGEGTGRAQPPVPAGRVFEKLPVVMKPRDPEESTAIVFFHSSDNPYGNPFSVWRQIARGSREFHKERFYGWATKQQAARFPLFNHKVHVIRAADVPGTGTRYHIVDPCSGRNWFQIWALVTPDAVFVYREWPGHYYIPGQGVPGDWAVPDGKKVDGRMGPAQKSFGWGFAQYKQEIARLEGWEEYEKWEGGEGRGSRVEGNAGAGAARGAAEPNQRRPKTDNQIVMEWDEHCRKREEIQARFLDARFGNVKGFEEGGMVTLIEQLEAECGLTFYPTCSDVRKSIDEGVDMINNALFYDTEKPVNFFNRPRLYISDACQSLIFALSTWTGDDGQKGATKDPIDCLRFLFLASCEYVAPMAEGRGSRGGGVY